jgi:hypothetical protein
MSTAIFCPIGEVLPLRGFFERRGLPINRVVVGLSISFDINCWRFAVSIALFSSGTVIALTDLEDKRRKAMTVIQPD